MEAKCPGCGQPLLLGPEHRGTTVACPRCGKHLSVPVAPGAPRRETGVPGAPAPHRSCPRCGQALPPGRSLCPGCGTSYRDARDLREERQRKGRHDVFAPEKAGIRAGVLGGLAMIVIAAVWFFLGYQAGYIFYYPPILALVGVFAMLKGLAEGNLAGGGAARTRGTRRAAAGRRARREIGRPVASGQRFDRGAGAVNRRRR